MSCAGGAALVAATAGAEVEDELLLLELLELLEPLEAAAADWLAFLPILVDLDGWASAGVLLLFWPATTALLLELLEKSQVGGPDM